MSPTVYTLKGTRYLFAIGEDYSRLTSSVGVAEHLGTLLFDLLLDMANRASDEPPDTHVRH